MKSYPVPSYGDHFVNHPCGFLFNNQDSLAESVLRQSGVSGNVSSKDFFLGIWHSCWPKILQVVDMLKTNECPLKIHGWKMFHFLLSKNCPFSGSTFIRFRGLFKEVFLKHLLGSKLQRFRKVLSMIHTGMGSDSMTSCKHESTKARYGDSTWETSTGAKNRPCCSWIKASIPINHKLAVVECSFKEVGWC